MDSNIYLCYKRTLTSIVAASLVFERLRNNGYSVFYSRKLRDNDFIQHISEFIKPIKDVIVLLDERSFQSLKEGTEKFLGSWFGRELQEGAIQKKNIIVICLNGYTLPDKSSLPEEIHFLYDGQTLELDTFDLNISVDLEAIIDRLISKPAFKYIVENREPYGNSADFLIYSNGDCNIYEFGYLIATLDSNVDKHHPFKYTVNRSGEHNFYIINNDTGQIKELTYDINPGHQKYLYIEWESARNLALLTEDDIKKETDGNLLYTWGKSFFFQNPKRLPDYHKSLLCFMRAAELDNQKAIEFIRKYDHSLSSIFKVPQEVVDLWYKLAAEYGSPEAWMKMGERHEMVNDFVEAINCYKHAKDKGHAEAAQALERCRLKNNEKNTYPKDMFLGDLHTIILNFERQINSGRVDRFNHQIRFEVIVEKLKKVEKIFSNSENKRLLSHFDRDSVHSKYRNRLFELLGFLANRGVFENLSHKDILEICFDEKGENQSSVKELRRRMGDETASHTLLSKMFNRMNDSFKRSLNKAMNGIVD